MKKTTAAFYTAQILTGVIASAAAYALLPRQLKRGQVVVITGGSRGLGFALAERFGRAGAKLVLSSRNDDELEQARENLLARKAVLHEDDILLVSADLTDESQASGLIDAALHTFGHIDILVNNAGIIEVGPVENQSLDAYERAMATNFFAALYTTYAAMPSMLARRAGAIVNIASIGGKFAVPHLLPYVASKFALVGFSEGLHAELRHKGIRVTTVCPGLMRTGGESHAHFTGQVEQEKDWFDLAAKTPMIAASVSHAARRIVNAVAAGRAEITITPQAWLAARIAGLAPETTQWAASMVNQYLLPEPAAENPRPDISRPFWATELQSTANEF
ncbi:SDR family NAD(P)-dependent oxidoreductase [Granulicella arctica]|uniref:SDR family NAD(P)-dependent oxidoreductase n=1 Tax=Granulicella arctica TaxID=940613 RepID=UPI0021DF7C25|nr:SDR family NAD(P)-dependent oxidoreductase [Granulicella arctica]